MFQTTRRRLALWYAGVTALLLVLFSSVVYGYVRTTLVERVDDTLNHVVEVVQRSLVIENAPASFAAPVPSALMTSSVWVNVEDSFRQNSEAVDDDHIDLEWFDDQGRLVWSTLDQPINVPLHVNPYGETVRLNSDHLLRQITRQVIVGDDMLGYLRVSHPWFEVTAPSQRLMVDLAAGIVLIVAVVAGVGWFLSGLAMEPVQDSYQKLKQFTADASHELRNPIAVIQTNVQVALADPEPDAQFQQEQFQVIERITRRLGKLVDDLLFLARQDSGIVQLDANPILLGGLLVEVVSDQRAIAAEKGVLLNFEYPNQTDDHDDRPLDDPRQPRPNSSSSNPLNLFGRVQGDRNQLTRLFTNLISNAIQYTPPTGQVTISLQRSSHIESRTPSNEWAVVRVSDSGIGIAPDEMPYIFDRFYRVDCARSPSVLSRLTPSNTSGAVVGEKAPGQPQTSFSTSTGVGLGLAIAKTIVDNHQGHITVESSPEGGATFTVCLPLIPPTTTSQ